MPSNPLLGVVFHWLGGKGSSRRTRWKLAIGLATLVVSTVVVGYGNYLGVQSPR
jgi:hypothetical protein